MMLRSRFKRRPNFARVRESVSHLRRLRLLEADREENDRQQFWQAGRRLPQERDDESQVATEARCMEGDSDGLKEIFSSLFSWLHDNELPSDVVLKAAEIAHQFQDELMGLIGERAGDDDDLDEEGDEEAAIAREAMLDKGMPHGANEDDERMSESERRSVKRAIAEGEVSFLSAKTAWATAGAPNLSESQRSIAAQAKRLGLL